VDGYCFKCGEKREMKGVKNEVKSGKNGTRYFVSGACSDCGTRMSKAIDYITYVFMIPIYPVSEV
jgi:hypothetical protein